MSSNVCFRLSQLELYLSKPPTMSAISIFFSNRVLHTHNIARYCLLTILHNIVYSLSFKFFLLYNTVVLQLYASTDSNRNTLMSQSNKSPQREQNRPRIKKSGLVRWVRGKKVWRLTGGVLCWWWMVGKKKCRSALTTFHSRGPSYEKSLEWPRGVHNGLVRAL